MTNGSDPSTSAPSSVSDPTRRTARTVGILALLAISAFLAITRNGSADAATDGAASDAADATSIAIATNDLVAHTSNEPNVTRVTGGYVPEVGIVLTIEVNELPASDIDQWTMKLLQTADTPLGLGDGEEVVFLLDIAQPSRTSRLISLAPADLAGAEPVVGRQAPATSTAPLRPTFEAIEPSEAGE